MFIVTVQAPVPLHAPPQLLKVHPLAGVAVSVTAVPGAKFALHRLGDTRQSHDLERTSRDPSDRTRGDTAMVLGLLGEPSATRVLLPMLHDRDAAVRLQAAEALWRLGSDEGLSALVASSISKFPDDQMIALFGLAGPKDPRALGHIEGQLTAEYLLLATGSYPHRPSLIPFDDDQVYDSDTILRLDRIPGTMTVLGAA